MTGSQWLGGAAAVRGIYCLRAQINIISTVLTGSRAERSSRWADSQEAVYTSSERKIKKKKIARACKKIALCPSATRTAEVKG